MIPLHDLLLGRRDAGTPVCRDGADVLDYATFLARVRAIAARLSEQPAQRYALCIDDPFNFACALFALFTCGKEPVIPAHAAPGYLADLSNAYDAVLTDAGMPALASQSKYVGSSLLVEPAAAARRSRSARRSRNSTQKFIRSRPSGARLSATQPCSAASRIIISTGCCFACSGHWRPGVHSTARSAWNRNICRRGSRNAGRGPQLWCPHRRNCRAGLNSMVSQV
jgi:hypothetical protein